MSIQIKTEWNINESLNKKLDPNKLKNAMAKAMTQEAVETQKAVKDEIIAQDLRVTGRMLNSETHEINWNDEIIEFLIKNSTNYWGYVNFGTKYISPRNFVQNALNTEQPAKKVAEKFESFYKQ